MSELARTDDPAATRAPEGAARPAVHVVAPGGAPSHDAGTPPPPNAVRSGLIGYVVGLVLSTVAFTIAGAVGGFGIGSGFGLGLFIGVWGGGGFGFMLGATIPLARHIELSHRPPRSAGA